MLIFVQKASPVLIMLTCMAPVPVSYADSELQSNGVSAVSSGTSVVFVTPSDWSTVNAPERAAVEESLLYAQLHEGREGETFHQALQDAGWVTFSSSHNRAFMSTKRDFNSSNISLGILDQGRLSLPPIKAQPSGLVGSPQDVLRNVCNELMKDSQDGDACHRIFNTVAHRKGEANAQVAYVWQDQTQTGRKLVNMRLLSLKRSSEQHVAELTSEQQVAEASLSDYQVDMRHLIFHEKTWALVRDERLESISKENLREFSVDQRNDVGRFLDNSVQKMKNNSAVLLVL